MNEFYSQHYKTGRIIPFPYWMADSQGGGEDQEGRKKLIELLKQMQNDEERLVKTGQGDLLTTLVAF